MYVSLGCYVIVCNMTIMRSVTVMFFTCDFIRLFLVVSFIKTELSSSESFSLFLVASLCNS
jgi:hypothetical protein